jgi:cysteinyl-tRNA synthetase
MSRDDFKFSTGESDSERNPALHPGVNRIEQIFGDNRRIDDALLHALSLVLSSNSEYARSVSALLENDLSREQSVEQLSENSKELLEHTRKLIASQESLHKLIETLNDEYKEYLNATVAKHLGTQQTYMDAKFEALFENAGLTKQGQQYGPTDRLIIKIKEIFSHELLVMFIGAAIYHLIILAVTYYKGGH